MRACELRGSKEKKNGGTRKGSKRVTETDESAARRHGQRQKKRTCYGFAGCVIRVRVPVLPDV